MSKIGPDLIARCDGPACCANEFVVLPPDGDAGFEEYFERKADGVYEARHLFTRKKEQTRLILSYPFEGQRFDRFFASPEAAASNQPFEGCFGIDLTAYLRRTAEPGLDRLIAYIRTHPEIVFVLFVYASDAVQAMPLLGTLDQYFPLRMLQIPLPEPERLTAYTEGLIREMFPGYDGGAAEEIGAFYAEGPAGYDTAEFLVRELRERDFRGERQVLREVIRYMKDCIGRAGSAGRIGY